MHTYAQAQCILQLHGLGIRPIELPPPTENAVVLRQDPLPNELIQRGFVMVWLGSPDALQTGTRPIVLPRPPEVTVPVIQSGMSVEAAQAALRVLDLCARLEPPRIGGGLVIDEVPRGDTSVPRGTTVTLSIGIAVPNVVGRSLNDARAALTNVGFAVGEVTPQSSDQPDGTVTAQDPLAGSAVAQGRRVGLKVAVAPRIAVPNVVGRSLDDARAALTNAGFAVGQVTPVASGERPGTVVVQDPRAGAPFIRPLPAVDLTLAGVMVPNIVGKTLDSARRMLGDAGLNSVEKGWPRISFATVVDQNPAGGTLLVSAQSVITVTVGLTTGQWAPIAAGLLLVIAASVVTSRVKWRRKQRAPRCIRLRPRRDLGVQEIRLGTREIHHGSALLMDAEVRIRPVRDPGSQHIEASEAVLKAEEGRDHA